MINGANTNTLISCAADLCVCFCICKNHFVMQLIMIQAKKNGINVFVFFCELQKGTYLCAFAVWLLTCNNYIDFVVKCYGFIIRTVQV